MRNFYIAVLFCLSWLSLMAAPAMATPVAAAQQGAKPQSQLEKILARGTLQVGTTGDYKPFSYRSNAASPLIGSDIAMAQALAVHLGVQLEWVMTSWPDLMRDLQQGRFDIAMSGISISSERQNSAMFSLAYLKDGKTPITLCAHQADFQDLAQIDQPSVRVVVNPGGTNAQFVRANLKQAQIVFYPDNNLIFDQIIDGKADLMITDAIEARLQQHLKPALCALHPERPFNLSEKAYLLPQDAAWKAVVDDWLQQKIETGIVTQTLEKWLAHPWPQTNPALIQVDDLRDLLAQRLSLMEQVARYKWNQQGSIEDLAREQKIITSLQKQADTLGVPASWSEHFFRAQIEAAKQIQTEYFVQWRARRQAPFEHVPNLESDIRPQLDRLTMQILRQLALTWPALVDAKEQARITQRMRTLKAANLSARAVEIAIEPLIDGSAQSLTEKAQSIH